jgi:hypothetical protein
MRCKDSFLAGIPGSELSSTAHSAKRTRRCTKRDSHGNHGISVISFCSNPHTRHSLFHFDTLSCPKQTRIERWPQSCLEDRAMAEIPSSIAGIDAPPAIVVQSFSEQVIM